VGEGPTVVENYHADGNPERVCRGGEESEDRLQQLARENRLDNENVEHLLSRFDVQEFVETPLGDAVDFLSDEYGAPIFLHEEVDANLPITVEFVELPLSSPLTLIAGRAGLSCDYHYGCLWIVPSDEVLAWRDPTGVASLALPHGSTLAAAWNEPVKFRRKETQLANALTHFGETLAIEIDTSAIRQVPYPSDELRRKIPNPIPFRHLLGCLLYHAHCRCQLDGNTLVILPQE
jgi:hypothetical protein